MSSVPIYMSLMSYILIQYSFYPVYIIWQSFLDGCLAVVVVGFGDMHALF